MVSASASQHTPQSIHPFAAWLLEHGLQLLAVAFSALAAACYFVGRSALLGWYQAAGVSHLTFLWSAQDVMIRGVMQSWSWLYALLITFMIALGVALVDAFASTRDRLRMRGESRSLRALRWRFATEARAGRLARLATAALATARWRALGKRGAYWKKPRPRVTTRRAGVPVWLGAVLAAVCLFYFMCLYVAGLLVFHIPAFNDGANEYRALHVAATGHFPPYRQAEEREGYNARLERIKPLAEWIAQGRKQLFALSYVRLDGVAATNAPRSVCGWLMHEQDNRVLLMTSTGLLLKNFGDQPHSWTAREPNDCHDEADQVDTGAAKNSARTQ
jgi:hypothetical protein